MPRPRHMVVTEPIKAKRHVRKTYRGQEYSVSQYPFPVKVEKKPPPFVGIGHLRPPPKPLLMTPYS